MMCAMSQVRHKGLRYHSHAALSRPCVALVCEVLSSCVKADPGASKRLAVVRQLLNGADRHFARAQAGRVCPPRYSPIMHRPSHNAQYPLTVAHHSPS